MLAVDTNIFVRLIVEDDPVQTAAARSLLATSPIWVSKTVLLESNWVLEKAYKLDVSEIRNAFVALLGLENVRSEDKSNVLAALSLTLHGIDFADALHVTGRPLGMEFLTFDRTLIKRAARAGIAGVSDASAWRSQ